MARISLKEQYDNQSVIKQIVDLTDQIDGYDEEIEQATQTANAAKTTADAAKTEADAVKTTADKALATASEAKTEADAATTKNTEQDAQIAAVTETASSALSTATEAKVKNNQQDADIAGIKAKDTEQDASISAIITKNGQQDASIAAIKKTADNSLADVTIETDETSASLLLKNSVAAESSKAVPLASENATGMMTKASYLALADAQDRIAALEGKTIIVYVSFTSDDPSQEEITNLFEAKTGKSPVAGNQAVDIARSLAYQYSGTEWIKTTQEVGQWTNSTAGIIKGTPAGAENAGTLFAEADGTGAVNGWDDLVARVANNESAISTTIPATYATKIALDATDANVANIKQTADAATTKNEGQDTEIAAIKVTVGSHSEEIAALDESVEATDAKAELCYNDAALSDDQSKLVMTKTNGTKTEITLPSGGGGVGNVIDLSVLDCAVAGTAGSAGTLEHLRFSWPDLVTPGGFYGTKYLSYFEGNLLQLISAPTSNESYCIINFTDTALNTIGTTIFNAIPGLTDGLYQVNVACGSSPKDATVLTAFPTSCLLLTVSDGELTGVSLPDLLITNVSVNYIREIGILNIVKIS